MVTLKQIAAKLNLSVSTVSAVLNERKYCYVAEAKKTLIRETAIELGYVPNRMACGMLGLPTKTIGIVGSLYGVPVHGALLNAINRKLNDVGYSVILSNSLGKETAEQGLRELLSRGIDGLIFATFIENGKLRKIIGEKIPYLFINQSYHENLVTFDRARGMCRMTEHFIVKHGKKQIVMFTGGAKADLEKFSGYRQAMEKHHLPELPRVYLGMPGVADFAELAVRLQRQGVEAVLCFNDFAAARLLNAFHDLGVKVPQEIALSGFDGLELMFDMTRPTLTSVQSPVEKTAEAAVNLLLDRLKGIEDDHGVVLIEPELHFGHSCGC